MMPLKFVVKRTRSKQFFWQIRLKQYITVGWEYYGTPTFNPRNDSKK